MLRFTVVILVSAVAISSVLDAVRSGDALDEFREVHEANANHQELKAARNAYVEFHTAIVEKMTREKISLRQATETIFYYCLRSYPRHLEHIRFLPCEFSCTKLRIARHLVNEIELDERTKTQPRDALVHRLLAKLQHELQQMANPTSEQCELADVAVVH